MTIMLTREEAQQVLDSFLSMGQRAYDAMSGDAFHECNIAVSRLRTRLAQPEPEAMAWLVTEDGKPVFLKGDKTPAAHVAKRKPNRKLIPLYAGIA
jgi:hypothetical protein